MYFILILNYNISSSHVQMWQLDYKEGWVPKNWCFWTVVWRKLLRVPWTSKEIKPKSPALAGRFFTAEPTVKLSVNPMGDGDQSLGCVQLFETPWAVTCQAPLSIGFPRQEYLSGLPFPYPGDLPDSGIEHMSLVLPALAGGFIPTSAPLDTPS